MQYSFVTMGQKESKTDEDIQYNSYLHVAKYFHANMEWTLALESYNKLLAFLANKILQAKKDHQRERYQRLIDDCVRVMEVIECRQSAQSLVNGKAKSSLDTIHLQNSQHHIRIAEGDIDRSYENLFSRYMDDRVKSVDIDDAYIQRSHQIYLFSQFCRLLVNKCLNLEVINLTTKRNYTETQLSELNKIKNNLKNQGIDLSIHFSNIIHDREIRLSNGWVFLIGRGLDFYQSTYFYDEMDLSSMRCKETTIYILHS